jgi:hypothetical protein
MKVAFEGLVIVEGELLYRRGFWQRRDAWHWMGKRMSLALSAPRVGEVVLLREAGGKELCRLDVEGAHVIADVDARRRRP